MISDMFIICLIICISIDRIISEEQMTVDTLLLVVNSYSFTGISHKPSPPLYDLCTCTVSTFYLACLHSYEEHSQV